MDDLRTLLDQLVDNRLDYVMARSKCNSVSEALRQSGISRAAYYSWSKDEQAYLEDVAQRVKRETATRALMVLQDAAEQAAKVKVAGLTNRDERIKQNVATEILDRTIGKAANPIELTGKDGEAVKFIEVTLPDNGE